MTYKPVPQTAQRTAQTLRLTAPRYRHRYKMGVRLGARESRDDSRRCGGSALPLHSTEQSAVMGGFRVGRLGITAELLLVRSTEIMRRRLLPHGASAAEAEFAAEARERGAEGRGPKSLHDGLRDAAAKASSPPPPGPRPLHAPSPPAPQPSPPPSPLPPPTVLEVIYTLRVQEDHRTRSWHDALDQAIKTLSRRASTTSGCRRVQGSLAKPSEGRRHRAGAQQLAHIAGNGGIQRRRERSLLGGRGRGGGGSSGSSRSRSSASGTRSSSA